jgi:hypothetical protein
MWDIRQILICRSRTIHVMYIQTDTHQKSEVLGSLSSFFTMSINSQHISSCWNKNELFIPSFVSRMNLELFTGIHKFWKARLWGIYVIKVYSLLVSSVAAAACCTTLVLVCWHVIYQQLYIYIVEIYIHIVSMLEFG